MGLGWGLELMAQNPQQQSIYSLPHRHFSTSKLSNVTSTTDRAVLWRGRDVSHGSYTTPILKEVLAL